MFLRERSTQAEYFDDLRSRQELKSFYRSLGTVNRLFLNAEPFRRMIPRLLSDGERQQLRILDLGAGDGSLGRELSTWADLRGWNWEVTSLDLNPDALSLGTGARVAGSALKLPFASNSFDLVIASQMTHHLEWGQIPGHFIEAWRVSRNALLISDLHRNLLLYATLFVMLRLQLHPGVFISDGLISVKRGWRLAELRQLVAESGIKQLNVQLYFGARVLISGRKTGWNNVRVK